VVASGVRIKAFHVCEDVRIEATGQLTAIGLMQERMFLPPGDGPIVIPPLAFLVVVAGLKGQERVSVRHAVTRLGDPYEPPPPARELHDHKPDADEHSFIYKQSLPDVRAGGTFRSSFELECALGQVASIYDFTVARHAPRPS
jgi:hypothetical protein